MLGLEKRVGSGEEVRQVIRFSLVGSGVDPKTRGRPAQWERGVQNGLLKQVEICILKLKCAKYHTFLLC